MFSSLRITLIGDFRSSPIMSNDTNNTKETERVHCWVSSVGCWFVLAHRMSDLPAIFFDDVTFFRHLSSSVASFVDQVL